jgi:membrane-bound lytic murein transglycosylase MltF
MLNINNANPVIYEPRPPLMQVSAKEVAKDLLDKKQYVCLTKLIGKESSWNPKAQNPVSTASGIGQMLDSTYSSLGMKKSTAEITQLTATLSYIARRHAHPCGAWKHFQKNRWY